LSADNPGAGVNKPYVEPALAGDNKAFDFSRELFTHEALAERALAHVKGDKVVQAYQRSDLLEQRRPIMQQWADTILPTE